MAQATLSILNLSLETVLYIRVCSLASPLLFCCLSFLSLMLHSAIGLVFNFVLQPLIKYPPCPLFNCPCSILNLKSTFSAHIFERKSHFYSIPTECLSACPYGHPSCLGSEFYHYPCPKYPNSTPSMFRFSLSITNFTVTWAQNTSLFLVAFVSHIQLVIAND